MKQKTSGLLADFAPIRDEGTRITICYGLTKANGDLYEWYEIYLPKKQNAQLNLQMVKDAINADIDARTDEKILDGYEWTILHGDPQKDKKQRLIGETVKVWLSRENQSNYKAKYDLHYQKPEALTFPTVYKIAENDQKEAIFEEFQNFEELEQFYLGGIAYIEATVQAGWAEKKAIDWTPYEEYFPKNGNNSQE